MTDPFVLYGREETIKQLFRDVEVIERYFGLTYVISGEKALS